MLARLRSRTLYPGRRGIHAEQRTYLPRVTQYGVFDLLHQAVVDHLGVVERFHRRHKGFGGDVALDIDEELHPLVHRLFLHPFEDELAHLLARIVIQVRSVGIARFFEQVPQPNCLDLRNEQTLHKVGKLHPATVLGTDGKVLYRRGAGRDHGGIEVYYVGAVYHHLPDGELEQVVVGDRPEQVCLHALPPARAVSQHERRDCPTHGGHSGSVACDLYRAVVRPLSVVLSGECHVPAALRAHQRLVRAVAGVRTLISKSGYRGVYEARIERAKGIVVHAVCFSVPRNKALHDYVRRPCEFLRVAPVFLMLQIENDALLAPVPHRSRRHCAIWVAAGRLYLDDPCAEVGHDHRGD